MQRRYRYIEKKQAHPDELPTQLIVLDEFLILRSMLLYWWQQMPKEPRVRKPAQPPHLQWMVDMLALARTGKQRILKGVQRPDAELWKSGQARDNMRQRMSLSKLSPDGAQMMWDDSTIGTKPTGVRGRGWATDRTGTPRETQYWLSPSLIIDSPIYTDRMTPEEIALAEALRPAAFELPHYEVRASGLIAPAKPAPVSTGGAEELFHDVVDVMVARLLQPGMMVKLDRDGNESWTPALIEAVEEQGDLIELEVLWHGGSGETIELDRSEEVMVTEIHDPEEL
jgi:hypothetical protein